MAWQAGSSGLNRTILPMEGAVTMRLASATIELYMCDQVAY